MEILKVNYGDKEIQLKIPKDNLAWEKGPEKTASNPDTIFKSLENPIGSKKISELAIGKNDALIIIDDNTRNTPANIILPHIISELKKAGLKNDNITILVALGTHREMTDGELEEKCGLEIVKEFKIIQHDHQDKNKLVYFGETESGLPIWINKYYYEAEFKVAIGKIIPHVDVVWSGGAKIVLPGICGKETVEKFHISSTLNKEKLAGKVDNFIRNEMEDIAEKIGLDFIVNVIIDGNGNIIDSVSGHFISAHRKGVEIGSDIFEIDGDIEKVDMILVSSYPADEDFWQAGKAVSAVIPLIKEGGNIVLISPCYNGFAPDHRIMLELLNMQCKEIETLISSDGIDDKAAAAVTIDVIKVRDRNNVYFYSEGIERQLLENVGMFKVNNLEEYIDNYVKQNTQSRIGVIHGGTEIMIRT